MNIKELFKEPKIIGIVGNVNEGKSNLIYFILNELNKIGSFNLYAYGLRNNLKQANNIYSVKELEQIKDSVIVIDEMTTLWDLEDRKKRKQIENTLRLINHNNNIVLLSGVPENFKKFISSKIDIFLFKKVLFSDFINGSRAKNIVLDYKGNERGTEVLNLNVNEVLIYDGNHYDKVGVSYMKEFDTKKGNLPIIKCPEKRSEFCAKKVEK